MTNKNMRISSTIVQVEFAAQIATNVEKVCYTTFNTQPWQQEFECHHANRFLAWITVSIEQELPMDAKKFLFIQFTHRLCSCIYVGISSTRYWIAVCLEAVSSGFNSPILTFRLFVRLHGDISIL